MSTGKLVAALCLFTAAALAEDRMTYRDAARVAETLQALAAANPANVRVFSIGSSIDYRTDPAQPAAYPILALRISGADAGNDDNLARNGFLVECGMHAREWLATESCLAFAEYLAANVANSQTEVPAILAGADIWIIPLTNVAGRRMDDAFGGDPTRYSTSPNSYGWRGNADTRMCEYGVDLARNFSIDWESAQADCTGDYASQYRGFTPFATDEAAALRAFVQNHTLSMALIVHSNLQKIWNIWDDDDVAGAAISTRANQLWSADLPDKTLALERVAFGRREGQFSAWLARPSDTPGLPDVDTHRGIQTIFVELPFVDYSNAYAFPADTGNGFHPSSDKVKDMIQRNFIPMALGLAGFARTPGCAQPLSACPDLDFGLVGAKIAQAETGAGKLETTPATLRDGTVNPARDLLALGDYTLAFRVQDFSDRGGTHDAEVQVTLDDGAGPKVQTLSFAGLLTNEARTGQASLKIERPDQDYTLTLEVRPAGGSADNFSWNDKKVFKFRSRQN